MVGQNTDTVAVGSVFPDDILGGKGENSVRSLIHNFQRHVVGVGDAALAILLTHDQLDEDVAGLQLARINAHRDV